MISRRYYEINTNKDYLIEFEPLGYYTLIEGDMKLGFAIHDGEYYIFNNSECMSVKEYINNSKNEPELVDKVKLIIRELQLNRII